MKITDAALVAAAMLSDRYITGRKLPDKAIDLVDEAGSRLRMEIESSPVEVDQLRRAVDRMKMEELALDRETDEASRDRLAQLRAGPRRPAGGAPRARGALGAREGRARGRRRAAQADRPAARRGRPASQRDGDLAKASEILYGRIPELEKQIEAAEAAERERVDEEPMVREAVGPEEIAEVVEAWTGIPTGRLLEGETAKLLHMEDVIGERLIGQRAAVAAVSDAVRRSRAGISDPDRPTGSFLFLGPTGVGKTELAKSLADFLFDDDRAIVRIDMSEYSEKHSVARLVGAPPGYVGYEEGGQLTEAVRRRPYSVVLLDEVEKAHPEVFDILLQVLDDGRLTDGQGRTVDFRNVVLILTSNLGSMFLVDPTLDAEKKHESVMAVVRQSFKPEFLNRLDEIVVFDALTQDELSHIVDLQVAALAGRLAVRRITPRGQRRREAVAGRDRLRPVVRRPAAAPPRAERHRRPPRPDAALRPGPRRLHGPRRRRPRRLHPHPHLTDRPSREKMRSKPSSRRSRAHGRILPTRRGQVHFSRLGVLRRLWGGHGAMDGMSDEKPSLVRPRQVTTGALLAVVGSVVLVLSLSTRSGGCARPTPGPRSTTSSPAVPGRRSGSTPARSSRCCGC